MKKKLFAGLVAGVTMFVMSSTAFALIIQSESAILNPGSTVDLWAYSYDDAASAANYINSSWDYVRAGDPYANAEFQGYVTGTYGPWSGNNDSWGSNNIGSGYQPSVHVFDTYITSTIDQTVNFASRGDDGHSFFVDDAFLNGSGYYPENFTVTATLDMVANTEYKLTYIGANCNGPFAWWFNMSGAIEGTPWAGPVSGAYNITMNAATAGAPVPEPATMLLFIAGLAALAGTRLRKKK